MAPLKTSRLTLRRFTLDDAPTIARLCHDTRIADTTLRIPHPYEPAMAVTWISGLLEDYRENPLASLAITLRATAELIGSIGTSLDLEHRRAELGYWIAPDHWNRGYATEALRALIDHGFNTTEILRFSAYHFANNPASGRVLQKAGMSLEGTLRQYIRKNGRQLDCHVYAMLRSEWERDSKRS
ncbi:MAG: GNAT family N-acetyltransferase [Opitutales bacterium]